MASESTPSSNRFQIAETDSFRKLIAKDAELRRIYKRVQSYIYPQLRENPFFGPNIKRLKGEFAEFYRHRTEDYRLFYEIDQQKVIVFVVSLRHRKDAYRKNL